MVVQKSSPHISFDGSESISLIRRNVSFFCHSGISSVLIVMASSSTNCFRIGIANSFLTFKLYVFHPLLKVSSNLVKFYFIE